LSSAEWQRFVTALRKVQSGRSPNPYDRLSRVHFDNNPNIHNVASFFPWHRQFLRELEVLLQQQDSSVTLPYWAWSFDSQAPEASPIFTNAYYGSNGRGSNSCVQDGQFRSYSPAFPRQHCLTRQFNLGNRIGAFYSVEHINRVVSTSRSYDALRQGVEFAPHAAVHVNIGSDMSTMYSPNDPIFYAHHAYIDKIWADWQGIDTRRMSEYGGRTAQGAQGKLADRLAPWNARVQDVMDTRRLCYTYQAFSRTVSSSAPSTPSAPTTPPAPARPSTTAAPSRPTAPARPTPMPTSRPWNPWGDDDDDDDDSGSGGDDDDDWGDDDDEDNWGLVRRQTAPTAPSAPTAPENIPAGDRSVLTGVRVPDPIPQAWCTMNRIPVQDVRKQETVYKKICHEVNKIPGYISPASLWLRDELTEKLITPTKKFIIYENGRPVQVTPPKGYSSPKNGFKGVKDFVRRRHGGHLRDDPRRYWKSLERIVGPVVYPVLGSGSKIHRINF
jgi:tyrosinase